MENSDGWTHEFEGDRRVKEERERERERERENGKTQYFGFLGLFWSTVVYGYL